MKVRYFISWIALSSDLRVVKVGNSEVSRTVPITGIEDITGISGDLERDMQLRPDVTLVVTNWRRFEGCE